MEQYIFFYTSFNGFSILVLQKKVIKIEAFCCRKNVTNIGMNEYRGFPVIVTDKTIEKLYIYSFKLIST